MFCYFQFLIQDPERRLEAHGNTDVIREHPFFESIDWEALEERRVEPPLENLRKEVSGACSVLISCHKLLLKLHVKRVSNSLVEKSG